jgi:nucleotide-binding universal stress UspA family protein
MAGGVNIETMAAAPALLEPNKAVSMIKDLIVNLEYRAARDPGRDFAISVAETFDAHVAGIALTYEPGLPPYALAGIPTDVVAQVIAESEKAAKAAVEQFDAAAKPRLVSTEHRLLRATAAEAPAILSHLARRFDLSVIAQTDSDGFDNDDLIEASLFDSGRPVMIVPYIQQERFNLNHIVCCWDGSRAAARAVNDALPLLSKATTVDLLIVLNEKIDTEDYRIRGTEIAKHLVRHDVKARIETEPAADTDVASAILSYVADNSATLIVMGGYGHAKLREVILGGVTRDMLKSMTVPVFMSH